MKSPSIESIYSLLHKHLLLIESYTEIPNLSFIFKACRLKPYSYFFEKRNNKITLYTWWFDEYGNSIRLDKNKKLKITYGDLSLDKTNIVCTDLYYGLSIDKILKISKFAYVSYGTDEDMYQDCALVSFLGIDNYLRTYLYLYGYWQQVSPLLIGTKHLEIIAKNLDLRYYKELPDTKNVKLPCADARAWLTCIPISEEFSDILDKQCGTVSSILNKIKGASKLI